MPFEDRAVPHPSHAFRFSLGAFESQTVYLRVRSDSELLYSTLLYSPASFELYQQRSLLGRGAFYGMLFAMGLYNLLLFIRLRKAFYALYLGVLISFAGMWWLNSGMLGMLPPLARSDFPLELLLADLWMFFRLAFTRSFLHVRQVAPRTDRAIAILQWGVVPAWAAYGLLLSPSAHDTWGNMVAFALVAATLVPGVQARHANVRMARWYVEATGLLATGLFIGVLVFAGVSLHPAFAGISILLATLLELFVLSLALAERLRDLLDQREQALRQVQADRLSSLQGVVGGVAHELNSPLGSLRSSADSLARVGERLSDAGTPAEDAARARKALPALVHVVQDATARISEVVRALHDFAQVDSADHGELDLSVGLDNALVLLKSSLERVDVTTDYGELPPVPCRPAEINQVFMSVLKNAVEAMPKGGRLEVRTRSHNGRAEVVVRDTGVGIPPDVRERLFEPRLSRSGSRVRMALGLSTAKRIIDAHEGEIAVAPNLDGPGTHVTIALPMP